MERITSYSLPLDARILGDAFTAGRVSPEQVAPFRALLGRITAAADGAAVRVYVCARESDALLRDYFAWALARTLIQHVPSTLLVDCDFLSVGMNGVVPHRDGLGFLDLLLYGSSLGVIAQETSGAVRIVGAGSFPVARRMPFVSEAFSEAARRLSHHARCVVFTGPLEGDDGKVHPIATDMNIVIRVCADPGTEQTDPEDSRIAASTDGEVFAVHLMGAPASTPTASLDASGRTPATGERPTAGAHEAQRSGGNVPPDADATGVGGPAARPLDIEAATPVRPAAMRGNAATPGPVMAADSGAADEPGARVSSPAPIDEPGAFDMARPSDGFSDLDGVPERSFSSTLPRIFTVAVVVLFLAFIAWWIWRQNAGARRQTVTLHPVPSGQEINGGVRATPGRARAGSATPGGASRQTGEMPATVPSSDSMATGPGTGAGEPMAPANGVVGEKVGLSGTGHGSPVALSGEGGDHRAGTKPADAYGGRIVGLAELARDYPGQYVVHVSSFRDSSRARIDEEYLLGHGEPAFVAHISLGSKGVWYRVYVGPWGTRASARDAKKNLDELARVTFTRIARISRGVRSTATP